MDSPSSSSSASSSETCDVLFAHQAPDFEIRCRNPVRLVCDVVYGSCACSGASLKTSFGCSAGPARTTLSFRFRLFALFFVSVRSDVAALSCSCLPDNESSSLCAGRSCRDLFASFAVFSIFRTCTGFFTMPRFEALPADLLTSCFFGGPEPAVMPFDFAFSCWTVVWRLFGSRSRVGKSSWGVITDALTVLESRSALAFSSSLMMVLSPGITSWETSLPACLRGESVA
mmetsp:Transcript_27357/g.68645  ORF Transcript_27357/g.68645 Transcript_27357/m.68645 type:complete len:229 (-) Transcript_27357:746-1432(-)